MFVLKNFQLVSGLVFVLFVLSDALAKRGLELSPRTDSESLEEIQEDLLRQVQLEMKMASQDVERTPADEEDGDGDVAVNYRQCNCSGAECSCCHFIQRPRSSEKYCVKMTYELDKKAILVSLTLGSHIFPPNEVPVSATQPPPIAYNVLKIWWLLSMSIEFHNYKLEDDSVNGCLKFKLKTSGRELLDIEIGCFQMALHSSTIQQDGQEEPLYFEGDKDSAEGPEPIYPW